MTDDEFERETARCNAAFYARRARWAALEQFPARSIAAALSKSLRSTTMLTRLRACRPGGLFVLAGGVGTGKTTCAADRALRGWLVPRFIRAAELARTSRYDDEGRSRLLAAQMLVIDDLGAEDKRSGLASDLDEIVDSFYSTPGRELIITTNLEVHDFEQRYDRRITDRLAEAGVWIDTTEPSLRSEDITLDVVGELAAFRRELMTPLPDPPPDLRPRHGGPRRSAP